MSTIEKREAANAALIEALWVIEGATAQELRHRLDECRDFRHRRRSLGPRPSTEEMIRFGPRYRCKTVACHFCRTAHISRKVQQAAALFGGADNAACSLFTLNAAEPVADLDGVDAEHRRFADALDNWRDALAKVDRRFRGLAAFAVLEVQHRDGLWFPHWHVALHHPGVDRQEIVDAARQRWPGPRRVNVKPFYDWRTAAENASAIVEYALKFQHEDWPVDASAALFLWLRKRAALRSVCVMLRPKRVRPGPRPPGGDGPLGGARPPREWNHEPLPVLFGCGDTLWRGPLGN